MATVTKVTPAMFNAMKILLASGSSQKEVAEAFSVSKSVVYWTNKSETFEEYKNNMYMTSPTYRKKKAAAIAMKEKEKEELPASKILFDKPTEPEKQTTVVVQATHYMMEELKQMNEHLKSISNKIAFIVDELTR